MVVIAALVFAARLGKRRTVLAAAVRARPAEPEADPAELERAADSAEAAGEFATAVRLRFRAGLLRLARAGVVEPGQSPTSGQLRRVVAAPEFDDLVSAFDRIVYGRRPASAGDATAARESWKRVLSASRAR